MNQQAFPGLLKKEWLLAKNTFVLLTLIMSVIWSIAYGYSFFAEEPSVTFVATIIIVVLHLFYSTLILITGLMMEAKSHIWLHSPQSIFYLIGSKLLTAIYLQVISIIIASVLLMTSIQTFSDALQVLDIAASYKLSIIFGAIMIIGNGTEIAILIMFYWSIYHAMGSFYPLRKFRVVLFFIFLVVCHSLILYLENTALAGFKGLWPLPYDVPNGLSIGPDQNNDSDSVTIGGIIYFFIKSIILFYASAWLLNKVVEVK